MKRMICIPAERYYKMLEAYDQAMEELEQLKKPLKSWQTLQRRVTRQLPQKPDTTKL